jgi:cytochrome c peroxidase
MKKTLIALGLGLTTAVAATIAFQPQWLPPTSTAARAFGLPPLPPGVPAGSAAQAELGRKLFFDRRLSFNETMSCAMCHVPEEGFGSRASKTAVGIEGRSLKRNAPTLLNVAWQRPLFHDGRESSLVTQAWAPFLNPDEMANPSIGFVLDRLRALRDYDGLFEQAFDGRAASMDTVGAALAAYQATLVAGDSRFDRWLYAREATALSAPEQRGYRLFTGKAGCSACHLIGPADALFADGRFHVTGVGFPLEREDSYVVPLAPGVHTEVTERELQAFANATQHDLGRFEVTHQAADRYAFKTPSLRNVAHSAPYMHDGSLATLEAVVRFYDHGAGQAPGKSRLIQPLRLSEGERRDLVAFLLALDGRELAGLMASRPADARP